MKPRPAKHGKRVIIMCRVGGHSERGGHTGPTGPGPGKTDDLGEKSCDKGV